MLYIYYRVSSSTFSCLMHIMTSLLWMFMFVHCLWSRLSHRKITATKKNEKFCCIILRPTISRLARCELWAGTRLDIVLRYHFRNWHDSIEQLIEQSLADVCGIFSKTLVGNLCWLRQKELNFLRKACDLMWN